MILLTPRRSFLKSLGLGISAATTFSSGILPLLANAAAPSGDYKALVCINLNGGNDAFNSLVPTSEALYGQYSKIRQELALPKDKLHQLKNPDGSNQAYGFHPELKAMAELYNSGKLAAIANLGNLIEPVEKSRYQQNNTLLPANLFAHNDQAIFAQTLNNGATDTGWAGRIAEALGELNINQQLAMNITLSGANALQRGQQQLPFGLLKSGIANIDALSHSDAAAARARVYLKLLANKRSNPLQQFYTDVVSNSLVMSKYVGDILNATSIPAPLNTAEGFSQNFSIIAKMIAANNDFNIKRQIFFVELGSFDTHANQLSGQAGLLSELNKALTNFYTTLAAMGYADKVVTFTLSEFGRTLSRNGTDGTDHGWGSHHWAMGDAVKGQNIIGTMPSLELGSDDDIGEGRIIPTISFEQYAATLSKWFGLADEDIATIFPNLKNFTHKNLGFLA